MKYSNFSSVAREEVFGFQSGVRDEAFRLFI